MTRAILLKSAIKSEAEIIKIEGTKIFLSMKKLQEDPWTNVEKKYKVGELVKGKVIKTNPFGLFVELDKDIHGLAHVSELSDKPVENYEDIAKPGDIKEFKIISIEPNHHRLGLSLKAMNEKPKKEKTEPEKEKDAKEEKKEPKEKKEKKEPKAKTEKKPKAKKE